MIAAIGADGEVGFTLQQLPFALDGEAPAKLAGAATVVYQAVAQDPDRILRFSFLDRDVAGHVGRIAQAVVTIPIGSASPRPRQQLVVDIVRPVGVLAADDDESVAPFSGGMDPVGEHAGEGTEHGVC